MEQKEFRKLDLKDAFLFATALEESYMTMEELLADREAEGKAEGSQLMLNLVSLMVRDGLVEAIPKLSEDKAFCKSMLEKYHLE